ncbi:MAG: hypothetical protein R3F61_27755 [Myxococcota bacterium]
MTLLRVGLALALKNLLHHGMSIAGATVLFTCMLFMGWVLVLSEEQSSLMAAATGTLYYLGPLFVLFLNERLVARDLADGTAEFLSALPMSAPLRLGVPFVFGLFVVMALGEAVLLSTAVLASRREGVPFGWFLLLHLQCGTYLLAWHALAFCVAHTGRWRWLTWWSVFMVTLSLDGGWIERPFRTFLWHGVLADPIDQARSVPPWDAFPVTLAWALLGVVLAVFLGTWRGGSLPARWFAPADTRQRATLVLGAVIALAAGPLIEESAPTPDTWSTLPALPSRHADVRVAGTDRLRAIGGEVVVLLDGLGDELGVERWPTVVLHPASRGLNRHVRRATGDDESLVLLVDPTGPPEALVREIASEVLVRQTGDLAERIPDVDWVVRGAAGYLRPSAALDRRLALVTDPSLPYPDLVRVYGRDLAEAVAAARLTRLGSEAPCVLRHALGTARGSSFFSASALRWSTRGDWLQRVCGVSVPDLPPGRGLVQPEPIPLPPVHLAVDGDAVVAELGWAAPRNAVLRRQALDPLELAPGIGGIWRVQDVSSRTRVNLGFSPTQPVSTELMLYWAPIEGWLTSGREGT